jgi:hypothetical protein
MKTALLILLIAALMFPFILAAAILIGDDRG